MPLLFWLLVWECAALWAGRRSLLEAWTAWRQAGDAAGLLRCLWEGQTFVLPAPPRVAQELLALAGTADFWRTAAISLCRVFAGAAIGVAAVLSGQVKVRPNEKVCFVLTGGNIDAEKLAQFITA